jgi:DNA-directed RNA polymerase specialized sigma24 family protein
MATPEGRWTLNPTALASLIERLGAGDPQEYETIRRKLIGFLELRGALRPEVAADETLDRVARKLEAGERIENLRAFVFGVARHVLLEGDRRERRERVSRETWVLLRSDPGADAETERLFACLEHCLKALTPENRALIEGYHGCTSRADRVALGARLKVSDAALRTRAHRIRNELSACLGTRLSRPVGNE